MGFLNPFNAIFETKEYPHARALRTSFTQKLKDTYFVWAGSFRRGSISWLSENKKPTLNRVKQDHFGLFDYLTLFLDSLIIGLIRLMGGITNACTNEIKNKNLLFTLASPILLALFFTFALAIIPVIIATAILRYVSAAIFTLAVSPFVLITYFGAKLISRKYFAEINQINVAPNNCDGLRSNHYLTNNLSTFLINNKLTLHDLKAKITVGDIFGSRKIEFVNRNDNEPLFSIDKIRDQKAYLALCNLNVGGLSYKTEKIRNNVAQPTRQSFHP